METKKPKTWPEVSVVTEMETYGLLNNTDSIDSIILFSSLDIWHVESDRSLWGRVKDGIL